MAILNMSAAQSKAVNDWIHAEYGKKAGLLQHEYVVQFDDAMINETEIKCGKQILILCKFPPWHPDFKPTLRRLFSRVDIKGFLRSQALVRASDAIKWRALKLNNATDKAKDQKHISVNSYNLRYITSLEVVDKKTRMKVEVTIEGSAFEALDKALKIMYGDKLK